MTQEVFSVWEGVYESFEEAGGDHDAFETDRWIEKQKETTKAHLENLKKGVGISKDYPLPLVVSILLAQKDKVSVLDFGGGMGAQYLDVLSKVLGSEENLAFVVVDGKKSIENRPKELDRFDNLSFYDDLGEVDQRFDIVHIGSTLQYIEDWEGLLRTLVERYDPEYFVFSDLLAGDIPTFVSHQKYYGKKIPHRFFGLGDILDLFSHFGYQSLFKSLFVHKILGQEKVFPNQGILEKHRISRGMNLVLAKR